MHSYNYDYSIPEDADSFSSNQMSGYLSNTLFFILIIQQSCHPYFLLANFKKFFKAATFIIVYTVLAINQLTYTIYLQCLDMPNSASP